MKYRFVFFTGVDDEEERIKIVLLGKLVHSFNDRIMDGKEERNKRK